MQHTIMLKCQLSVMELTLDFMKVFQGIRLFVFLCDRIMSLFDLDSSKQLLKWDYQALRYS